MEVATVLCAPCTISVYYLISLCHYHHYLHYQYDYQYQYHYYWPPRPCRAARSELHLQTPTETVFEWQFNGSDVFGRTLLMMVIMDMKKVNCNSSEALPTMCWPIFERGCEFSEDWWCHPPEFFCHPACCWTQTHSDSHHSWTKPLQEFPRCRTAAPCQKIENLTVLHVGDDSPNWYDYKIFRPHTDNDDPLQASTPHTHSDNWNTNAMVDSNNSRGKGGGTIRCFCEGGGGSGSGNRQYNVAQSWSIFSTARTVASDCSHVVDSFSASPKRLCLCSSGRRDRNFNLSCPSLSSSPSRSSPSSSPSRSSPTSSSPPSR